MIVIMTIMKVNTVEDNNSKGDQELHLIHQNISRYAYSTWENCLHKSFNHIPTPAREHVALAKFKLCIVNKLG